MERVAGERFKTIVCVVEGEREQRACEINLFKSLDHEGLEERGGE